MKFEDWIKQMRAKRLFPFGTAYEIFCQKAWDTAIQTEREACAQICIEMANQTQDIRRAALEVAAERIMARGQA